jgi:hypothetical protein
MLPVFVQYVLRPRPLRMSMPSQSRTNKPPFIYSHQPKSQYQICTPPKLTVQGTTVHDSAIRSPLGKQEMCSASRSSSKSFPTTNSTLCETRLSLTLQSGCQSENKQGVQPVGRAVPCSAIWLPARKQARRPTCTATAANPIQQHTVQDMSVPDSAIWSPIRKQARRLASRNSGKSNPRAHCARYDCP